MARIDTLGHFLTDVADAIRTKTGSSDTIQASNFDTEIENIPSGGGAKIKPTSIRFQYLTVNEIDLTNFDDSELTSMEFLFYHCENLQSLNNTNNLIGQNVSKFTYMLAFCYLLEEANLEALNPSNATSISCTSMFYQSYNLLRIDLKNFEVTPTNTSNMFFNCSSLKFIDIRKMELTGLSSSASDEMFGGRQYKIPADCEIIVKDTANKTWIETNFNWLTNVKTVAEYEAE